MKYNACYKLDTFKSVPWESMTINLLGHAAHDLLIVVILLTGSSETKRKSQLYFPLQWQNYFCMNNFKNENK